MEEDGSEMHRASTSAAGVPSEEEDDEADEEMILVSVPWVVMSHHRTFYCS